MQNTFQCEVTNSVLRMNLLQDRIIVEVRQISNPRHELVPVLALFLYNYC